MQRHNIPTSSASYFERGDDAILKDFLKQSNYPLVLKADGLAAGKGVAVCQSEGEAGEFLDQLWVESRYGSAANVVLVEEFLRGEELSFFILTDGTRFSTLPCAQD